MNTPALRVPKTLVPGLLTDEALQEQLKQFTQQQNATIKQDTPTSAVSMAQRVQSEYFDAPVRATIKAAAPLAGPLGPLMDTLASSTAPNALSPRAAQDARASDIGTVIANEPGLQTLVSPLGALLSDTGPIGALGQLTPEEQQAQQQERITDAQRVKDRAVADQEAARDRAAGLTDNMLQVLAGPLDPGVDPVSAKELREQQENAANERIKAAEQRVTEAEKAPPPKQTWWLHGARTALKGFSGTMTGVARGAILPIEMALGDGERSDSRAWIDTVDAVMEKMLPGDKARSKDFFTKLTAGGGGMVGFMAAGFAANMIGLPASAATTIVGAAQGGADQFEDAERFGASGVQKLLAYLGGAGIGASEAIPINRALGKIEQATGGSVSRLLQQTASSSLDEFLQELGQSIGQDFVAQKIYDENREIDIVGALENAAVGGILGGMMGSSIGTLRESGLLNDAVDVDQQTRQPEPTPDERQGILDTFMEETQNRFEAAARQLETATVAVPPAEPVGDLLGMVAPAQRAQELVAAAAEQRRPATQIADDLASTFAREPLFDYSDQITDRGGTVPAPGEDGFITLRHYASQPREIIDPAMRGTGPLRGEERARLQGEDAVDRSYYGVYSGADFREPRTTVREYATLTEDEKAATQLLKAQGVTQAMMRSALESRFRQEQRSAGYRNEGLGNIVHEVKVRPDELYNANEDPLNLRDQLPDATGSERVTRYERLVKEAGFRGMYFPTSALGQTAILFDAATPARIINEQFNLPVSEIATRADFENPTPETFRKGGWAVITATQEAQGDFTSEQNRANDERLRKRLKRDKIEYMEVKGAYQGAEQGTNYLIFAPEDYARRLGQQFSQESILTRDGLIYTDGTDRVVPARATTVGPDATQQDFYSTLPDGTSFTMDLDFAAEGTRADLLAATATRQGYAGEQQRPSRGIKGAADTTADVNLARISDNFIRLLDLTVRQGRFTLRGANVMGQFSTRTGVIRLRTWNDLSTLVHEGGHAMEQAADGALKTFIKDNKLQLSTVAKQLYGGDLSNATQATVVSEGFAEFFRTFTLNRAFAQKSHPTLTQNFEDLLRRTDPALLEGLDAIGEQFAAWLQMPSTQLVRNMIVSGEQQTGAINEAVREIQDQGFGTWMQEVARRSIQGYINRYAGLNTLVNDILNIKQAESGQAMDLTRAADPRVLIRLAANSGNRAMVQVTDGVMPYQSTTPATASLRAALLRYHGQGPDSNLSAIDPVRQQDFAAYLVALRGIDEYRRYAQGLIERPPLAATQGDLTTTVKELEAQYGDDFKQAAQMVHEYGMGLWEKSYRAGLISDEVYKDGLTRQFYVPLQRDISDKATTVGEMAGPVARGQSIIKRFRGSDRDVIDPMDSLMAKTFMLERVIAENDVKVALARLADKAGTVGALVERVPAQRLTGTTYSVQEIARQLTKDPTISQADAADLMTILEGSIEEGNRIALFRSQQALAAGENMIFFWENGKLAALQLADGEIGFDVVNTLNGVGHENIPTLVNLVSHTSSVFRSAVTSWPDFLLVNFIRDQMSAFILTDVGYKPFVTGLRGVGDELRQADWARQYNAAMGIMGGMNSASIHQARVNRDIAALRNKGYVARVFGAGEGIPGAIRGLARVTELTETGTRLGIFRATYEKAKADGLTDWEASIEASYNATDYIDFGLRGNSALLFNRTIPFLNAQLQGLYKMMRTLGGDEVRQRKGLNFVLRAYFKDINNLDLSRTEKQALKTGRAAWVKMASLGLLSALLSFAFQDDPDYQDASEYLRTTGWVIPLGNGEIAYIPKPFELAVLANFVERAYEHATGDQEAKYRFLRGAAMNLKPPTAPPAILVGIEQAANYSFFSGRDIVPDYMRALEPEMQYNHTTTEFAKQLGNMFGWSPMRIDHVMSGLGASAYRDLTSMYNMTDPNRPSSDKTDWPITRRFVRDARRGAVSAQDFWKMASTVDGSLRRAEVTYKNFVDAGKERAAEDFLNDLSADEKAYALLNTHFKADAKRLHPFYRTRQLTTIVSAMRRELYSDLGVEYTGIGGGDPLRLSAKEKAKVDDTLSEYARREVRNAMVYMKSPGWETKAPLPTEPTLALLAQISPDLADEFDRRVRKAKVYDAEVIQDYWPDVKDRLLSDRENAFLNDVTSIAKVMR